MVHILRLSRALVFLVLLGSLASSAAAYVAQRQEPTYQEPATQEYNQEENQGYDNQEEASPWDVEVTEEELQQEEKLTGWQKFRLGMQAAGRMIKQKAKKLWHKKGVKEGVIATSSILGTLLTILAYRKAAAAYSARTNRRKHNRNVQDMNNNNLVRNPLSQHSTIDV